VPAPLVPVVPVLPLVPVVPVVPVLPVVPDPVLLLGRRARRVEVVLRDVEELD
jgi:hypothetical protein